MTRSESLAPSLPRGSSPRSSAHFSSLEGNNVPPANGWKHRLSAWREHFGFRDCRRNCLLKLIPPPVGQTAEGEVGLVPWALRAGVSSVAGAHRPSNQDRCYANPEAGVILVADGVGGHEGGAAAAQILADTVPALLLRKVQSRRLTVSELAASMHGAIDAAHHDMVAAARKNPRWSAMSSTLVLGVVGGQSLFITHLGDSRAYLVREGLALQLTSDHTLVQAMVDAGDLDRSRAQTHPLRHIIMEFVSPQRKPEGAIVRELPLRAGDRLLFTTDGLTDVVDPETFCAVMVADDDPQSAADKLVEHALQRDSKDNISCVVVHVAAEHCAPQSEACGDPVADVESVGSDQSGPGGLHGIF